MDSSILQMEYYDPTGLRHLKMGNLSLVPQGLDANVKCKEMWVWGEKVIIGITGAWCNCEYMERSLVSQGPNATVKCKEMWICWKKSSLVSQGLDAPVKCKETWMETESAEEFENYIKYM